MSITLLPTATGPTTTMTRSLRRRGACMAQWLQLPGTATAAECASIRYWDSPAGQDRMADRRDHQMDSLDNRTSRSPVIFVHGYAGTEHIWGPLRDALTTRGFGYLIALRYNAFRTDIHQVADWLVAQSHRSMMVTGASTLPMNWFVRTSMS